MYRQRFNVTLVSGIGVMSSFSGSGILVTSANASSTLSSATDMPIVGILAIETIFEILKMFKTKFMEIVGKLPEILVFGRRGSSSTTQRSADRYIAVGSRICISVTLTPARASFQLSLGFASRI